MRNRLSVEELRPDGAAGPVRRSRGRARRGARVVTGAARLSRRGAGGILDQALDALVERFGPCLGMALLFWLPFGQFAELIGFAGQNRTATFVISSLWQLATVVPQALTTAVATSLVGETLARRNLPVGSCILRGIRRTPGVVVIFLVCRVLALPLLCLCLVPFFLVQWVTWSAVAVYVLEGETLLTRSERARARRSPLSFLASFPRRVSRSIARSARLANAGWGAFGRFAVLYLVGEILLAGSLEATASLLSLPQAREFLRGLLQLGSAPAEFVLGAANALFLGLSTSFRASLTTAYCLDLRVRREGLDLELALRALPGGPRRTEAA